MKFVVKKVVLLFFIYCQLLFFRIDMKRVAKRAPRPMQKKRCTLCNELSANFVCFPANGFEMKQRKWLATQFSGEKLEEELKRMRRLVMARLQPRWCHKHFGANGLPIEMVTF